MSSSMRGTVDRVDTRSATGHRNSSPRPRRVALLIALATLALVLDVALARAVAQLVHGDPTPPSVACVDGSTLDGYCAERSVERTAVSEPLVGQGYGPFAGCPQLRQGSRGECVRRVQLALRELGANLQGTATFGPRTHEAVVAFQRDHPPINASGVVGLRTQAALLKAVAQRREGPQRPAAREERSAARGREIVGTARRIMAGRGPGWTGGPVPYVWGGGHGDRPGPGTGTCAGYDGPTPCPAEDTDGLDCSGFVRWTYALTYGEDVLGPGNTDAQRERMTRVETPAPGDLVFFGTADGTDTHHVGVYIGDNTMINAPTTGEDVQADTIEDGHVVGYFRLDP